MNLVIGATSQLAQYFPEDYMKISSRNIDFDFLRKNCWDAIYITFAEQRIYDNNIDYITPNYMYVMQIINTIIEKSSKIVCYTSCELWNNLTGYIETNSIPNFYPINNEYCISKLLLLNKIIDLRKSDKLYNRVIFMHPFYFNSIHRNEYFLFGKIFNSIIDKKKIKVGNLDFYRDMVHANFVVKKSIELNHDAMLGSGKLFHVRDFIKDLYHINNMDFSEYVDENNLLSVSKEKLIRAKVDWEYTYQNLLEDTQNDLVKKMRG